MPTTATAAVTAAVFAALYAGHQVGDHIVQTNAETVAKGAPTGDMLAAGAHPWAGWTACLRHVGTYTLAQVVALALLCVSAPLNPVGGLAALAVSASSHAVIDRRWIVRLLVEAKGCQDWREAPYFIDQSLHVGALLVAAVSAAVVTGVGAAAVVLGLAAALVGVALVAERRAAAGYVQPVDPAHTGGLRRSRSGTMGAMVPQDDSSGFDTLRWAPGTLLHALGTRDRQALLRLGTRRVFQAGKALINEGGHDADAFVLLDGCTKVVGNTADGRNVLLSIRVAGEVVGELAALDDKPRSASVVACTTVEAQVVNQQTLLRFLAERPAAARAIHAAVRTEFRRMTEHRLSVNGAPVAMRVALVLNYLVDTYGRPGPDGIRIEVPLSQPDLASLLGVSEPSMHRALADLRTRGVIRTGYRQVVVCDPAALHALATGAG